MGVRGKVRPLGFLGPRFTLSFASDRGPIPMPLNLMRARTQHELRPVASGLRFGQFDAGLAFDMVAHQRSLSPWELERSTHPIAK